MKINPVAILQPYLEQKKMFCNGDAKVTVADENASNPPSVIYHKTEEKMPLYEGRIKIYFRPAESPEQQQARFAEIGNLFTRALATASADLRVAYDDALSQLPPSLVAKNWGFSVDHRGSVVVLEGSSKLSKSEKDLIEKTLTQAYVGMCAEEIANIVVKMLELDRMPAGDSSSMGKFDVTRNNFQDIVDLRAYLEVQRPREKYLSNPYDYVSLHYCGGYFMMDQISAKAEAKYDYKGYTELKW